MALKPYFFTNLKIKNANYPDGDITSSVWGGDISCDSLGLTFTGSITYDDVTYIPNLMYFNSSKTFTVSQLYSAGGVITFGNDDTYNLWKQNKDSIVIAGLARGEIATYGNYTGTNITDSLTIDFDDSAKTMTISGWSTMVSMYPSVYNGWSPNATNGRLVLSISMLNTVPETTTYTVTNNLEHITADADNVTSVDENAEFTLKYTVESGYKINTLTSTVGTVTIADNLQSATITGTATSDIVVTGTAIALETYTVTANLEHVTAYSKNETEFTENSTFSLVYTVDDDYQLATAETNIGVITGTKYVTVSGTATENIVITLIAEKIPEYYTITTDLTGCSADVDNVTTVKENTKFALKFYVSDGYKYVTGTCNVGSVTVDGNIITVTGFAAQAPTITITCSQILYVHIDGTITDAFCNYADGAEIDNTVDVIITPNTGYEFIGNYTYKTNGITYTVSANAVGMLVILTDNAVSDIYLSDVYRATKKVEKLSNFANIYRVTSDTLDQLAKVRFVNDSDSVVDYGTFITKLYHVDLPIDGVMTGETANIILGTYDSDVAGELPSTYKYEFTFGTVTVPEIYNNVYDYINTIASLYIPFCNPIALNVYDIVNRTLTINCIYDLYSGTLTVNLENENGNIIQSETSNIVTNIPFIQEQNNTIVNQISQVYNRPTKLCATVEIVRNIPYDTDSDFGKETVDYGMIGDKTGYIECQDVDLVTRATEQEKDDIIALLKGGVFING